MARSSQPLPTDPAAVTYTVNTVSDLAPMRAVAAEHTSWLGLGPDGVADLQLIATELATNSLQHAGTACRVAFWRHERHIVCQVSDGGRFDKPRDSRPPLLPEAAGGGRGLWLVNAIADLVRTYQTATGTTIQAYIRQCIYR